MEKLKVHGVVLHHQVNPMIWGASPYNLVIAQIPQVEVIPYIIFSIAFHFISSRFEC